MTGLTISKSFHFLQEGGEMGRLTREFDWSKTAIGSPDKWPQSLRLTVSMILRSKFPMFLWWGENLIQFYNDAYRPSLGNEGKHPTALGQNGADCWQEIWAIIYPLIAQVRETGEATWSEDQLIPIYRNGKIEDVYWTFGYSPIYGETDKVEGVLVVCTETTEKVQSRIALQASETKLLESEKNLRSTILQAPVAMAILKGPEHIIEIANVRMYELWGKPQEQLAGKPLFVGLPEVGNQGFEELLRNVFTTGETYSAQAVSVNLPRQGIIQVIYISFVYEPHRDGDGHIDGVLVVAYDVSPQVIAQQKIEEEVIKRTTELAEANANLLKSKPGAGAVCLYRFP